MADQAAPSSLASGPPLVGRVREQAALRDALASALAGRRSLVLIGGEAGIGKTALAEATLAEAMAQGALVLVGRCYDLAETPPYGPWADALARVSRSENHPPPPDLAGGSGFPNQAALIAAVRDSLVSLATVGPLVLLLDDLHWADLASLDLLRTLGRQLADLPLLLLATYRADELTRRHPLYALLPTLEREAHAVRLDLRPLDAAALRTLVARYALRTLDTDRLVAWLASRSEGNAFFAAQLLRALEDANVLAESPAGWALGDLGAVGLPTPLRHVLDARLARLGEENVRLLTLAAVIGQEVPLVHWAAVAETNEDNLLDAVDAAVDAHLVTVGPDGAVVRIAHALIREALYEGLVATRRRRIHRRVAEVLAAVHDPDPDAVAYHFQRAGDQRAAEWLTRAGERARRTYALLTAAERYEAALAILEREGGALAERARILSQLGWLRRYSDPRGAIASLDAAIAAGEAAGDLALGAYAHWQHGLLHCFLNERRVGLPELAAAADTLEALSEDDCARLSVMVGQRPLDLRAARGSWLLHAAGAGQIAAALSWAEWWKEQPTPPVHKGQEASPYPDGWLGLGMALALLGRPGEAAAALRRAAADLQIAEHHLLAAAAANLELTLVTLTYDTENLALRGQLAATAVEWAGRGAGATGLTGEWFDGQLALVDGRWDEQSLAQVVEARLINGGELGAVLARLRREIGRREEAWALVRWLLSAGPAAEPGDLALFVGLPLQRVAADLALDAGDLPSARDWLAAHDRWLAWSESVFGRSEGQLGWTAYHRAAGDLAAARRCGGQALAHASAPRQPLALLAAHRLLGELDTATGQHVDAAAHLDAALALAEACAAPYERALTLLALAELHVATGAREQARAALEDARTTFVTLGAAPALVRADALAARLSAPASAPAPARDTLPFGLTAREAEVLQLVARGLPNTEVATQLSLSHRTIEQHLRSIYNKLGVDNRTAATRVAIERGLV